MSYNSQGYLTVIPGVQFEYKVVKKGFWTPESGGTPGRVVAYSYELPSTEYPD